MENMDDCLDNDDSTLARESDLNFAVDNVEKVSGYVDEKKFKRRDDLNEDLNQHEQQSSPSLHADADFRYEISESLPEKSCPATTESDHGSFLETKFSHDRERTQSPFKDNNRYQGEMDELHGTNFINPSSQSKSQTFHNEMGTEDSAHSQESPLAANANQGAGKESDSDMGSPTAASHAGRVKNICSELSQYESIKSSIHEVERDLSDQRTGQSLSSPKSHLWDNKSKKDDSPGDHRMPGMYHLGTEFIRRTTGGSISPMTKRQMSISPEGSPAPYHSPSYREHLLSHQGSHDLSYPPRSPSPKISSPPELRKGILPHHLSPTRQTSSSTQGRRQRSQNKDSSALKHISASPRCHRSPPRSYHTPPRSHRSPIRRDSYGYQRDYRDRSRSRSPYSRAQHRSTRGRHSPRQRSPYPEYHSHHRSPRRRPWSPPPNRKTGLGKPGRNLFVAGFSFITTERDLERKFSRYGRVRDVRIVRDKRSGDSRGFGFLTLERDEDADAAIRALDETEWNGRIILVEKSKS